MSDSEQGAGLCSQGAVQKDGQPAGVVGGQGIFLWLLRWTVLSYLMLHPTCAYVLLCWITVLMAGCLSRRAFAWLTFKFDGALLRRSRPCIYSERSLVVCGKELGPGAEATTSRTKPQNLHNCQGLPICLPSRWSVSPHNCCFSPCSCHCCLREESILFNTAMLSSLV